MRTSCIAIILLLLCYTNAFSQICLPEGITFTSQSQVDSFSILYPNCTEIEGNLILEDTDSTRISNLNALINLTKINGDLQLAGNSVLEELTGLENIVQVGGALAIFDNVKLINILNLRSIKRINGSLSISNNSSLTNLAGLENLFSVGKSLSIRRNDALQEITSLQTLATINGDLTIWANASLTSLQGIDNISHTTISKLEIRENPQLSECNTNTICRYLEGNGVYSINNNAFGCSEFENILGVCTVLPGIDTYYKSITISTNLTQQYLNIEGLLQKEQYQIVNSNGSIIKEGIINSNESIDLNDLGSGLYIFILIGDKAYLKTSNFFKF